MTAEIDTLSKWTDWTTILSSIFLGIIAFLTLRFTAIPKINISLRNSKGYTLVCPPNETATLIIDLKNVGRWYASPPAKNVILYINFPEPFELIEALYGSTFERSQKQARIGKRYDDLFTGNMKYFRVDGITLFYEEPGEAVKIQIKTPNLSGTYPLRIAALSDERAYQVCVFKIKISGGELTIN